MSWSQFLTFDGGFGTEAGGSGSLRKVTVRIMVMVCLIDNREAVASLICRDPTFTYHPAHLREEGSLTE